MSFLLYSELHAFVTMVLSDKDGSWARINCLGIAATSEIWSLPFWNDWSYGIRNYGVEVAFGDITCLLNFIKIYQSVQKLGGGGAHTRTDRLVNSQASFDFLMKGGLKVI
jgi:hypothetical protein